MSNSPKKRKNSNRPFPRDPRAAHTALLDIAGDPYLLKFWREEEWRALSAGEYRDGYFQPLADFGMVSVEALSGWPEFAHVAAVVRGEKDPFPEIDEIIRLGCDGRRGLAPVLDLLKAAKPLGIKWAVEILEKYQEERAQRQALDSAEVAAAQDLRHEAYDRRHPEPAYAVVEQDFLAWHAPGRFSLDQTIETELAEFNEGDSPDRAIWKGSKLMAVIRNGPDGKAEVVRFDRAE